MLRASGYAAKLPEGESGCVADQRRTFFWHAFGTAWTSDETNGPLCKRQLGPIPLM